MDNEFKKLLKDVVKKLKDLNIDEELNKSFEKHLKQPCTISIEKDKNGECKTTIEGTPTGILLTLAGLEKTVLEKTNPPTGLWELIKQKVGTKEGKENE